MNKKIIFIISILIFLGFLSNTISSETIYLNNPPYVPSNPNPINGSININLTPVLSWTGGDPDTGDRVTYDIYFGIDPNPSIIEIMHPTTTYNIDRLEYDTQYYWRIDSMDNYGLKTIGDKWTFHTKENSPPNLPSNPNPSNGSTSVDVNTDINWIGGDPDNDIVSYNICFGTDPEPPVIETNYNNTTYYPGRLDYNTKYYWRINSSDYLGLYTLGPIWTFNSSKNNPPYIPSDPNPTNNSTNIDTNTYLSWVGGDPDIGDTIKYDIYLDINSNPKKIESNFTGTIFDPGRLEDETQYYWRINSKDQIGFTTIGPIWTFKTSIFTNDPPYKPEKPSGTNHGRIRISYTFSSKTIDPDGDNVYYKFDWDDGTDSGWKGPYNSNETAYVSHIWNTMGSYSIKVKAKDSNDAESVWSDSLPISMPKFRIINKYNIIILLEKILNSIKIDIK